MTPRLALVPLALLLTSRAAAEVIDDAAPELSHMRSQCEALLGGVAASGRNDVEIAAYCRAAYPGGLCRTVLGSLGPQPWHPGRVSATCREWVGKAGTRGLASAQDLQATIDKSVALKGQLGYQFPKRPDGSMDLEQTLKMKQQQTEAITKAYNDYFGQGAAAAKRSPEGPPPFGLPFLRPPTSPHASPFPWGGGHQGKWEQGNVGNAGAGPRPAVIAASGAIFLALVGAAAMLVRRRAPCIGSQLLRRGGECSTEVVE